MAIIKTMKISELRKELIFHGDEELVSINFHKSDVFIVRPRGTRVSSVSGFGIKSTSSMRKDKVTLPKRIRIIGIKPK